jgi:AraC family ethanolamine operon transcriptional activator
MAMAQRDAKLEATHFNRGRAYNSRLAFVDLGHFRFHDAYDDAHLARGVMEPGICGLLVPHGAMTPGLRVNGCSFAEGDGVFVQPGKELHVIMDGPQRWSGLLMNHADLAAIGGEAWLESPAAFFTLPALLEREPALRRLARTLGMLAHDEPARISAGTMPDALVETMGRIVGRAVRPEAGEAAQSLALHRRVRIVADAEDFLAAAMGRPIYTQEIAAALGVGQRLLTAAFSAVYGMSVHRYLLLRRLHLVRRSLMSPAGASTRIKTVALDHGFWHLGQFTRDYRAMFGETPTETLAGAHRECRAALN